MSGHTANPEGALFEALKQEMAVVCADLRREASGGDGLLAGAARQLAHGTPRAAGRGIVLQAYFGGDAMNGLEQAVWCGEVLPGDVLLFARPGILQKGIAFAQRRALADLQTRILTKPTIADAARWTHAAMAFDGAHLAEQTSPQARLLRYSDVERGVPVLILRPVMPIAAEKMRLSWALILGQDYPQLELLCYWFKWASKLAFRRKFAAVFRNKRADVCSGCVVKVLKSCGIMRSNVSTEAWYPARFAVDGPFTTVGEIVT